VQLAVPHVYPSGQQPATEPPSSPQRYQPVAHALTPSPFGTSLTGTATVTDPEMMVVMGVGGHEVVAQLRPVWQQPPPARARQA
jgi:hypothetical protein